MRRLLKPNGTTPCCQIEKEKCKPKKKPNTLTTADFRECSLIFSHDYHEKGGRKSGESGKLKKSVKLASLNYSDPCCQLDQSPSLE